MIELEILGVPVPYRPPRVHKFASFNPRWQEMQVMKQMIQAQYKGPLLKGPLECMYDFYMPIPKATSKRLRIKMLQDEILPTKRPDRDNLAKLLSDVLMGIVFVDDSQIVSGDICKWYSDVPRTIIRIKELQPD